jgi:hypothetical protein
MAYIKVPTRTTSDTNSPNDINQLQTNLDTFFNSTGQAQDIPFDESVTSTAGLTAQGGKLKYKGVAIGINQLNFDLDGNAYVDTNIKKTIFNTAVSFTDWILHSDNAPDATLKVDVNKNGASVFGATAFQITAGNTTATLSQSVTFNAGDIASLDIDSIGTNTVGGNFLNVAGV